MELCAGPYDRLGHADWLYVQVADAEGTKGWVYPKISYKSDVRQLYPAIAPAPLHPDGMAKLEFKVVHVPQAGDPCYGITGPLTDMAVVNTGTGTGPMTFSVKVSAYQSVIIDSQGRASPNGPVSRSYTSTVTLARGLEPGESLPFAQNGGTELSLDAASGNTGLVHLFVPGIPAGLRC